jgi:Phospholipase_D-nuclease N-terminal
VTRRKWSDLSPHTRRLIVVASAIEGVCKIAALIDLARRPTSEVRGSKARWAAAVTLLNLLGAVPIAYFVWGRRRSEPS